jgi:hypothetical protein
MKIQNIQKTFQFEAVSVGIRGGLGGREFMHANDTVQNKLLNLTVKRKARR